MPGPGWAKLARAARNPDHRDRAARASASLALPLLVGVLAGDPRAGMVGATGGFAGLLAGVVPFQRRARVLASLTIAFPSAIVVGTLAAPSAVAASVAPGVLAAVAAFVFRAFAVPTPREYPLVLACLMATGLPADPSAAPARALEAFGGAAAAFAIGMVGYRRPTAAGDVQPGTGKTGIRARLSAAMDRDALIIPTAARMGIAVAAGAGLGHAIGLSRPYWAGLTAAAVLQGATGQLQRRRAVDRAVGTVVGVVLAQPLVELHPPLGLDVAAVALCMFVAQIVIRASYAVAVVFLTQLPIFMMDLAGADPGPAITGARLVDTLIGCALGAAITQVPVGARLDQLSAVVERRSATFFARSPLRPISKGAMSTLHRDADARLRAPPWYEREPVRFLAETVRGVGQVDLQAKLVTGVVITIALFSAGWKPGVFGLLGAAVSTATAVALGVDRSRVVNGLEGYCGALIGIAAVTFLGLHLSSWLVAISGAMACTIITAAMGTMLGSWKLSPLTGPFCVVGSAIAIGGPGFERIWHGGASAALPSATAGSTALSFGNFVESLFTNVSEIFLLDKWWAGLIMLVGLGLASRKVMVAAFAGSLVGTLTAWAVGAPGDLVTEGIYGYNAVLVMIALGATFLAPTAINMVYAVVAAIFSTLMTATLAEFFAPFGGHTLTWPFNLTTWAFLAAVPVLHAITIPKEEHAHEPRAS